MTTPVSPDALTRILVRVRDQVGGHDGCAEYGNPELLDDLVVCACGRPIGEMSTDTGKYEPLADGAQADRTHDTLTSAGLRLVAGEADPLHSSLVPIDPTLPYGPDEVAAHMLDAAARLERGMVHEAGLVAMAHQAEMEYKLAHAEALAGMSGGDAEQRRARALLAVRGQYQRWVLTLQVRDAMKATTHSLRSVLSGYQSVAKSVTAVYGAAGQTGRQF